MKSESNGNFIGNQVGSNNNLKLLMIMIFTYIYLYLKRIKVNLNEITGLIQSISVDDQKLELEQEMVWYAARAPQDRNVWTGVNSAIYKLRTNQTNPFPIPRQKKISISIYKGLFLFGVILF